MIFGFSVFFCIYEAEKYNLLNKCPRSVNNFRTKYYWGYFGDLGDFWSYACRHHHPALTHPAYYPTTQPASHYCLSCRGRATRPLAVWLAAARLAPGTGESQGGTRLIHSQRCAPGWMQRCVQAAPSTTNKTSVCGSREAGCDCRGRAGLTLLHPGLDDQALDLPSQRVCPWKYMRKKERIYIYIYIHMYI